MDRAELYARIDQRIHTMITDGLFQEAEKLYAFKDFNALQTVGYQEIFGFMDGKYDQEAAVQLIKRNSRRYAKRQLTWFGSDNEISWFSPKEYDSIIQFILEKSNAL